MEGSEVKSVIFTWKNEDFEQLLKTCDVDDEVQVTLQYLPSKKAKILEAG